MTRFGSVPAFRRFTPLSLCLSLAALPAAAQPQWTPVTGTQGMSMNCLFAFGNTVFAGTQDDGFVTFATDGSNFARGTALDNALVYGFAASGSRLYAGTSEGVFASDDGLKWTQVSSQANIGGVISIAAACNRVFAGTYLGLWTSKNAGGTWSRVVNGPSTGDWINAVSVSGAHVFAAVEEGTGRIWRSDDSGDTWKPIRFTSGAEEPKRVLALGNNVLVCTPDSVHFSPDLGATWSTSAAQKQAFSEPGFYARMDYSGGEIYLPRDSLVYVSPDSGRTWKRMAVWPPDPSAFAEAAGKVFAAATLAGHEAVYSVDKEGLLPVLARARTRRGPSRMGVRFGSRYVLGEGNSQVTGAAEVTDPLGRASQFRR